MSDNYKDQRQEAGHTAFNRLTKLEHYKKVVEHKEKEIEHKNQQIEFLWQLLDNISTAGDIFKPEINGYFKSVEAQCNQRGAVAESKDGYTLIIKGLPDEATANT